jgi:5-methylcytosine-specific restriction enzyme A
VPTISKPKQGGKAPRKYVKGSYIEPRYNTTHWRNLRASVLQGSPLCAACDAVGLVTLAQMVDHINPVRLGGEFWDTENLQPLCNSCHASKSAKERNADPNGV